MYTWPSCDAFIDRIHDGVAKKKKRDLFRYLFWYSLSHAFNNHPFWFNLIEFGQDLGTYMTIILLMLQELTPSWSLLVFKLPLAVQHSCQEFTLALEYRIYYDLIYLLISLYKCTPNLHSRSLMKKSRWICTLHVHKIIK